MFIFLDYIFKYIQPNEMHYNKTLVKLVELTDTVNVTDVLGDFWFFTKLQHLVQD